MLGRRQMTFNETFESSLIEKNNEKFTIDKSLIKGIKYAVFKVDKMMCQKLLTKMKK
jgi:hypothetical protein